MIINNYEAPPAVATTPLTSPIDPQRFQVPYDHNPYFTGRDQILTDLHEALQTDSAAVLSQAIRGLGGIGKTQTAIEYAYRYAQDPAYPRAYDWVFWVKADTESNLVTDFAALARTLGLGEAQTPPDDLVKLAQRWLETHDRWLLIFDNADDPKLLKPYRPKTGNGRILLTSRAQHFDVLGIRQPIPLPKLSQEDSLRFLWERTNRQPDQEPPAEQAAATQLATELDGLPLALEQAGAYIKELNASFSAYWQTYEQQRISLLEQQTPIMGDYPSTVLTTWELNVAQVAQAHPAARSLLRLSAFLAADDIPYELLTQGAAHWDEPLQTALADANPLSLNQLLKPLADYSLIQLERERACYSLHRLVQAVERHRLPPQEQATWHSRAIAGLNAALPDPEFENWSACARLVPHVQALASSEDIDSTDGAFLLNQSGYFLYNQGRYGEAEPLYARSLAIHEQQLGADHPDTASSLNNLAELYRAMGRYGDAEPLYVRSLAIREQQLGADHPDTASSLNNLALLYNSMGRYGDAEPLLARSLAIDEKVHGAGHPEIATDLNNLAGLYYAMGRYGDAEPLYVRSLAIREQQLGVDHPNIATSLNNLAVLYDSMGRYGDAEHLYARSLAISEQQSRADHPDTAQSLNNLAALYRVMGRYGEAQPLYVRSLAIREQQLGVDHPDTAQSLNNLAELYSAMGRYGEAEPLLSRSLTICEQQLGADHSNTAQSLNNLAALYRSMGRYGEAELLFARSLAIYEQQLGADHPDTANSLNNLGALYYAMGRYDDAEPLYVRSLAIREQQLGADHPDTATSLSNLALLYASMGRYGDAEPLLARCLGIFLQALGQDHPSTQAVRNNFATCLQAAVAAGQAGALSSHPLTQAILAQLAPLATDD